MAKTVTRASGASNVRGGANGLKVKVLRESPGGQRLKTGDLVGVYYSGSLTDGTRFDYNLDLDGRKPRLDNGVERPLFAFTLGQNRVIQGWEQGLLGRRIGEELELRIPPELGYGSSGTASIPGDSTLIFRVVLVGMLSAEQLALPADQRQAIYYDLESLGLSAADLKLTPQLLEGAPTSADTGRLLVGTTLADTITGQPDPESNLGRPELLVGLNGDDRLNGGGAPDLLVGGSGADTFVYTAVSDSAAGAASRDVISDFLGAQGDRLDLQALDANSRKGGVQGFRYLGDRPFSGRAGSLRYAPLDGNGLLQADVNGDRQADLEITLLGNPQLSASHLLL